MFWRLALTRDDHDQNWIVILNTAGEEVIRLRPAELDTATRMIGWHNDVLRRARLIDLARAA